MKESTASGDQLDGVMLVVALRRLWRCWNDRAARASNARERATYCTAMSELEAVVEECRTSVWPALRDDLAHAVALEIVQLRPREGASEPGRIYSPAQERYTEQDDPGPHRAR
jgi:hypothetical protein